MKTSRHLPKSLWMTEITPGIFCCDFQKKERAPNLKTQNLDVCFLNPLKQDNGLLYKR
jgi:hypothetical protein